MGKMGDYFMSKAIDRSLDAREVTNKMHSRSNYKKHCHGLSGLVIGGIFDIMAEEVRQEEKARAIYLNELSIKKTAELNTPKHYDVHQPWDPIIIDDLFW